MGEIPRRRIPCVNRWALQSGAPIFSCGYSYDNSVSLVLSFSSRDFRGIHARMPHVGRVSDVVLLIAVFPPKIWSHVIARYYSKATGVAGSYVQFSISTLP